MKQIQTFWLHNLQILFDNGIVCLSRLLGMLQGFPREIEWESEDPWKNVDKLSNFVKFC